MFQKEHVRQNTKDDDRSIEMPQFINTNVMSINTVRILDKSQASLQTSMERLSSGMRINHARDDAAGMAISEGMTSQVRGMNQAVRNAMDGISLVQTADGALGGIVDKLQRVRELGVQSINGTYSSNDRAALDKEVQGLLKEIGRVANSVKFNGTQLLNGNTSNIKVQVGHSTTANDSLTVNLQDTTLTNLSLGVDASVEGTSVSAGAMSGLTINGVTIDDVTVTADAAGAGLVVAAINAKTAETGVTASVTTTDKVTLTSSGTITVGGTVTYSGLTAGDTEVTTNKSVTSASNAETLVGAVDTALTTVNNARADLGASQNRLETTVQDLKNNVENLSGARSRIQDADFAEETANLAKNQILQQAGMAMLAQANQLPQNVLSQSIPILKWP